MLGQKDIYYVFPPLFSNIKIILKKPKPASSIRKVWPSNTLAALLASAPSEK